MRVVVCVCDVLVSVRGHLVGFFVCGVYELEVGGGW